MIRVGHLSTAYHSAVLLLGTGWAEEVIGQPVEWHLFPTGPDIVNRLEKGELDFGYIGLTPAMIGIGRGVPIKCVAGGHVEGTVIAGKDQYCTLDEYGGDLKETFAQFRGKAIGTPKRGNIHEIILRHNLAQTGLDAEVSVVNYDSAELIAEGMAAGEVEAASATPSITAYLGWFKQAFDSKVIVPPNRLWPWNPSYGVFARTGLIEDQPAVVEAFLLAHERALKHIREHPHEAAKTVAGVMELVDQAYVEQAFRVSPRYCGALPQEYIDSTLRFLDPLLGLGNLTRRLTQDDIFDLRFIRATHPEPHHYLDPVRW